jgi:hypothetical protein
VEDPQTPGLRHDCEACENFRRGIAAAVAAGKLSLAADGRVLLLCHEALEHLRTAA